MSTAASLGRVKSESSEILATVPIITGMVWTSLDCPFSPFVSWGLKLSEKMAGLRSWPDRLHPLRQTLSLACIDVFKVIT